MKKLFAFVFLLSFLQAASQDTIACYFNEYWDEIKSSKGASYFRVGKCDRKNMYQGRVRDYYISGKIQMNAIFVNDVMNGDAKYYFENGKLSSEVTYINGARHGEYRSYYESGKLRQILNYDNGIRKGMVKEYYSNGNLKEEGNYHNGGKSGLWQFYFFNAQLNEEVEYDLDSAFKTTEKMVNVFDSLGNQMVKNGNGDVIQYSSYWKSFEKGTYRNGIKEGEWIALPLDGKQGYKESYANGKLVSGESWDKHGESYTYTTFQFPAEYEGGMMALMKYLSNEIKYPGIAARREIMGKVYIEFIVDVDGKIIDAFVLRGVHKSLDAEALRVVNKMKGWKPAISRGQHVKARFVLPINFKIQ